MMRLFYTRFAELCKDRGVSPSAAVEAIGLNKANASFWKRGSLPSSKNIQKLSEYFSVPVDYLLRDENDLASFPWLLDAPDADIPKEALDDAALRRGLARAQEQLSAAEKKGFQPEIKRWRSKCTDLCEMIEQLKKHTAPIDRNQLLLTIFEQLNETGQEKAIEWISEISKIPSYQRKD